MATKKILSVIASALLLLVSCDNYDVNMHTTINEDGTCSREFKISVQKKNDQGDIAKRTLDFDNFVDSASMCFDKTWKATWSLKGDSAQKAFPIKETDLPKDTFLITVKQDFPSIEKMMSDMPLLYNGKPYKAKGELTKSFKWFYTDYTYSETYKSSASEYTIPITKYVDKDTASYWFSGQPNIFEGKSGVEVNEKLKGVEIKVWQWIFANLISDACDLIAKKYDLVENAPMGKKEFLSNRDSLISYGQQHFFEFWGHENFMEDLFNAYFPSKAYGNAIDTEQIGNQFTKLFICKYGATTIVNLEYTLTMPGKIIDAGNGKIQDGDAHYKLGPEMFTVNDYTISATSRVTNLWAYIVSVLIILIAIFSFWYKKK